MPRCGDFIFGRIAQDAFDPVALADEVDEAGVGSVKHGMTRIHFLLARLTRVNPNETLR
jgi:hypothetical protein